MILSALSKLPVRCRNLHVIVTLTLSRLQQVFGASGLVKRELLSFPDPFAVLTVDGEQTSTTAIFRRSLSPTWNETFDV